MSTGATPRPLSCPPPALTDDDRPPRRSDCDQATLLGLYHGYDQARIALARVVCRLGSEGANDEATRHRIWSRARRAGVAADLFQPPHPGALPGVRDGAHSAALAAFATVSEQAEAVLRELRSRWPELCEHVGGPLPAPALDPWQLEADFDPDLELDLD